MKVSKSAIFLFELMAVILIFTVAAAICTDIFAKAFQVSDDSRNLTKAIIRIETVAEEFKADPASAESEELYYDENWDAVKGEDDAEFVLYRNITTEGDLYTCNLVMSRLNSDEDDPTVTQIKVASYSPGGIQGGGNG
jgi:hypothetical protein